MHKIKMQKQWLWIIVSIILFSGCSPKSQSLATITPTPKKAESTLSATPSQSVSTAPPAGLILLRNCQGLTMPCPDSLWLVGPNGKYRQIQFEGTYLNLAHNHQIASYINNGDIWLLNLRSGNSQNITKTIDCMERDTTWSPDDKSIAFIGCSDDALSDVYLLDISSGKRTNLTTTPDRYEECFSTNGYPASYCLLGWWSQQPSMIIAESGKPLHEEDFNINMGICHTFTGKCVDFPTAIGLDGKYYKILDLVNGVDGHMPALSPDGKVLAYDGGILYDLETGTSTTIFPSEYGLKVESWGESGASDIVSPSWSPDGKQIAWIGHVNDRGDNGLYVFDLSQHKGQLMLTYTPGYIVLSRPAWMRWSPAEIKWSPDSQWITLSDAEYSEEENVYLKNFLWVMERDGKIKTKFDEGDVLTGITMWSPDSKKIVFIRRDSSKSEDFPTVQMVEINGWKISQLDTPEFSLPIAWFQP
jgi:Tol biopolymer transport system component